MPKITSYITQDDGTTTVVISDVELGNKETLLLDNGFDVEVDVNVIDPFQITGKQRRKIFALVKDIEEYTGQPMDYMRHMFIEYVRTYYGYDERISLIVREHKQVKSLKQRLTGRSTMTYHLATKRVIY